MQTNNFLPKLRSLLRQCVHCGWVVPVEGSGFCQACLNLLGEYLSPGLRSQISPFGGVQFVSLFDWPPGSSSHVVGSLIRASKNGRMSREMDFYARWLVRRMTLLVPSFTNELNGLVVPCPPAKEGKFDHACAFAYALSRSLNCSWEQALTRDSEGTPQKRKSRRDRRQVRLQLKLGRPGTYRARTVYFIDDVITTGATAGAAWEGLGYPGSFLVLCLAYRQVSCGDSDLLLDSEF